MNIQEIHAATGIAMNKLRKLEKMRIDFGKLETSPGQHPLAAAIRFHLGRHPFPTVAQCLLMVEEPEVIYDLKGHRKRAEKLVADLGDVKGQAAPIEVTSQIEDAATGDPEAVAIVGAWLFSVLPDKPVAYHYLAVRLLIGLPPKLRESSAKHMTFVFMHVRQAFPYMWEKDEKGAIFYRKTLDL